MPFDIKIMSMVLKIMPIGSRVDLALAACLVFHSFVLADRLLVLLCNEESYSLRFP